MRKKGTKAKKENLGSRKTKGAASAGGESTMCEGEKENVKGENKGFWPKRKAQTLKMIYKGEGGEQRCG